MNQEIKERIDQINRGEIPAGYKKTKSGICPVEWKDKRLCDLFDRQVERNKENNKNVLTISAQQGLINQAKFFNKEVASENKSNYYLMQKNDFAYNKSYSAGYPFGAIKRLMIFEKGVVSPLYICFRAKKGINISFYDNYFESGRLNRDINSYAQEGARNHGLLNIAIGDFFNSHMLYPTPQEQQKIANVLMVWDKAIEAQNQYIIAREKKKKALMQKLLQPKPYWQKIELSKVLKERKTYSEKGQGFEHVSLTKDGIIAKGARYERDFLVKEANKEYKITYLNDICYNPANLKFGVISRNNYGSAIFSPIYVTFIVKEGFDVYFVDYYLTQNNFIQYIRKYEEGTIYERMAVKPSDFLLGVVDFPQYDEQKEIASILAMADAEISMEKAKLELYKLQKKSLMQLLLTGIVRTMDS